MIPEKRPAVTRGKDIYIPEPDDIMYFGKLCPRYNKIGCGATLERMRSGCSINGW